MKGTIVIGNRIRTVHCGEPLHWKAIPFLSEAGVIQCIQRPCSTSGFVTILVGTSAEVHRPQRSSASSAEPTGSPARISHCIHPSSLSKKPGSKTPPLHFGRPGRICSVVVNPPPPCFRAGAPSSEATKIPESGKKHYSCSKMQLFVKKCQIVKKVSIKP